MWSGYILDKTLGSTALLVHRRKNIIRNIFSLVQNSNVPSKFKSYSKSETSVLNEMSQSTSSSSRAQVP